MLRGTESPRWQDDVVNFGAVKGYALVSAAFVWLCHDCRTLEWLDAPTIVPRKLRP